MAARPCIITSPRDPNAKCPAPAAAGVLICNGHEEVLTQDLADTDLLTRLIHDMVVPTRSQDNYRGKTTAFGSAAPVALDALAAVDHRTRREHRADPTVSVIHIIEEWARWVTARYEGPSDPRPADIIDGLDLITDPDHLSWLLNHWQATPRFVTDIAAAAHYLREVAGEIAQPIGRHLAPHPRHPERDCGGRLYPISETGQYVGIQCLDCRERYDAGSLRRLGLILDAG